jgi:peptide chain release factor subunit 1
MFFYLLTGRGGQSALRFARLRMEKRHNYVRKVAEVAVQLFITNDKPNISGLVLAGSADFKTELSQSDMFDPVSIQGHFSQVARIDLVYLY